MSLIRGGGFEEHVNFNFEPRGKRDFTPTWRADSPFSDRHIGVRLLLVDELAHTIYDDNPNIPFWDF